MYGGLTTCLHPLCCFQSEGVKKEGGRSKRGDLM